jgi:hypothetical protein
MIKRPPPMPTTLPGEMPPPRSRYNRPRRPFSVRAFLIGIALGIGAGLGYAWVLNPVVEYSTEPWQLRQEDRDQYMVAVALGFAGDGNLDRAVERMLSLYPRGAPALDPFQEFADAACRLATTGYVDSNSGRRAIRSMMTFYQLQGKTGCADTLIPDINAQPTAVVQIELPTPTLPPPATKTPTPPAGIAAATSPTPPRIVVPTSVPQRDFVLANVSTFCDEDISGVIEVFVQDFGGVGIPGQAVRVRWDGGQDTFYTGLKPERGPAYADFQMEPGREYIIEMPGRSDPSAQALGAVACTTETGARATISYRAVFLPRG